MTSQLPGDLVSMDEFAASDVSTKDSYEKRWLNSTSKILENNRRLKNMRYLQDPSSYRVVVFIIIVINIVLICVNPEKGNKESYK